LPYFYWRLTSVHRIGEKFQQWSDTDPSLDEMLDSVTLYWFTESFARGIHPYRQFLNQSFHTNPKYHIKKPFGYSWYPKELSPTPKDWVATTGNMTWFRAHDEGGHFAAWEKPEIFVRDMEDFTAETWDTVKSR
jgi:microsomal epoxide hydrolase